MLGLRSTPSRTASSAEAAERDASCETDEAEADEKTIVENILSGQYSSPLRVVAFNIAEGWARDVTEDIAWAVLSFARRENRSIGKSAQEFLERALGVDAPVAD
jgi:hypothetical protein